MSGIRNVGKRSRIAAAGVLTVGLLGTVGLTQAANGAPGGTNGVEGAEQHRSFQTTERGSCSRYWIVVNANGTPARGSCGAKSSLKLGPGEYQVNWKVKERKCARLATIGLPGGSGSETPGFITTVGRVGKPKSSYVATYDTNGNPADRAFQVHLAC
ncbi:MAG: hypothetical protein K0Q93_3060 [Nocardioidaceae bacterium]|jgi:hypothetical protein|nr:hypothetical protein [Nocardioidaceae bacterium]